MSMEQDGFAQYLKRAAIRVFTDRDVLIFLSGISLGFVYCGLGSFFVLGAIALTGADPLTPMFEVTRNMVLTGIGIGAGVGFILKKQASKSMVENRKVE